jgi:hypothetical protein
VPAGKCEAGRTNLGPGFAFSLDVAAYRSYISFVFSIRQQDTFEGELWIPQDSLLAPLSYQTLPSSFLRRLWNAGGKIEVVLRRSFPYNYVGFALNRINTMGRLEPTYLLRVILTPALILLVCGCVGKPPENDVALIKEALGTFERGIGQSSQVVLDSVMLDRKLGLSARLLDSLSVQKKLLGGGIASKSFVIVGDSAQVELRLNLELAGGAEAPETAEKPLTLFLHKKKGKWRISRFSIPPEKPEAESPGDSALQGGKPLKPGR